VKFCYRAIGKEKIDACTRVLDEAALTEETMADATNNRGIGHFWKWNE